MVKCNICGKNINLKKDSYVKVEDYNLGTFYSVAFYHNKCYLDRINRGKSKEVTRLSKLAEGLLNRSHHLLNRAEGKDTVVRIQ